MTISWDSGCIGRGVINRPSHQPFVSHHSETEPSQAGNSLPEHPRLIHFSGRLQRPRFQKQRYDFVRLRVVTATMINQGEPRRVQFQFPKITFRKRSNHTRREKNFGGLSMPRNDVRIRLGISLSNG